ncbi:MAG TPA: hypothetical protein VGN81_05605 [Pseudonocardiaceae bacterium]
MYDDEDDEDETGYGTHNVHSGWSTNSIQARDIHGDVNFHAPATEPEYEYFTALPWGFTVAIYAVLFVVVSGYTFAIGSLDLSFWDWVKHPRQLDHHRSRHWRRGEIRPDQGSCDAGRALVDLAVLTRVSLAPRRGVRRQSGRRSGRAVHEVGSGGADLPRAVSDAARQ